MHNATITAGQGMVIFAHVVIYNHFNEAVWSGKDGFQRENSPLRLFKKNQIAQTSICLPDNG
jgi:hypothetical protein